MRFECKDELEYHRIKSDRSICPRRPDFNRLYSNYCKEKYGSKNGKEMFEHLEEKISNYNKAYPESIVNFQRYEESESNVTPLILTPLMKRVHTMVILLFCFFRGRLRANSSSKSTRYPNYSIG